MLAGGFAGVVGWLTCYPLDLIKSRLQTNLNEQYLPGYRGILQCSKEVILEAGLKGLFKGIIPTLIRALPVNCACVLAYEYTLELFKSI